MSAAAIARDIAARSRSAVEVFDEYAAKIEARNDEVNAIVLPRLAEAREEAVAVDAALARGEPVGPLAGVPFTCKDPFPVAGMRSPNGSRLLADYTCATDCEPVRRLRAAGAILLGKTNVSEFAMYWDSTNALFGSTRNPHDLSRTAGGSSGGEAAAVASGMSALGLGSDLGGSIRAPAHFTGILGLRTGRGTVPFASHHPMPASPGVRLMGTLGPMASTVDDLVLALSVLGPDAAPPRKVTTVAVFEDDGLQPVSRACREAVRMAAAALADGTFAPPAEGASAAALAHGPVEVVEARPPAQDTARRIYDSILIEEIAGIADFVGNRDDELSDYVRPMLGFARSREPSIHRYIAAFDALAEIEEEAAAWFSAIPSPCARSRPTSRRRSPPLIGRPSTASRPTRAASSRSAPTPTFSASPPLPSRSRRRPRVSRSASS